MPSQEDNEWQEEFDKKYGEKEGHQMEFEEIKTFISSLLLKQKVSLKQRMIDCVPPRAIDEDYGENKPEDKIWGKMNFNACREQTLSDLNEIDV